MDVVMSIKPQFVGKIVTGEKNYEFRKYIPKKGIDRLWIYTSSPISALEYVADIDEIITYPDKISKVGFGNDDFNCGIKKSKNAYSIAHLYRLETPLNLKFLKDKFRIFCSTKLLLFAE